MNHRTEFLYGVPGAEHLALDPDTVLDCEFDNAAEEVELEEWTVRPATDHLPRADRLLEWIEETAYDYGEVDEGFSDHLNNIMGREDVRAAASALLELIASKVTYCMADTLVSTTTYVLVDDEWHEKSDADREKNTT